MNVDVGIVDQTYISKHTPFNYIAEFNLSVAMTIYALIY